MARLTRRPGGGMFLKTGWGKVSEKLSRYWGNDSAKRHIRTWQERIKTLEELGFIKTKPSGSKKYGYILLIHPHRVVEDLKAKNQISDKWWGAYVQRATEVGFPIEKPKSKRQR